MYYFIYYVMVFILIEGKFSHTTLYLYYNIK